MYRYAHILCYARWESVSPISGIGNRVMLVDFLVYPLVAGFLKALLGGQICILRGHAQEITR